MFEALALVCYLAGPCIALEDERGPYQTRAACEDRLAELHDAASFLGYLHGLGPPVGFDGQCRKVEADHTRV